MILASIKNGFRKTGIYPFNAEAIDKTRLILIEPSPSSTPPIPTSTLPGAAKMESTPTENLDKPEHDFKSYKPCVITEGRTITDKVHQASYKEKEEIKSRKEKEKETRKKAREKKQETKLLEGKNKKLKQLAKKERRRIH